MNYLKQLQAFRDYQMFETELSSGQIALYYALLQINNKCSWIEWFTAANQTLETLSGLSRSGINKNRNVLKQLGLVDFESNGNRKATSYKICVLYNEDSTHNSEHRSTHNSTHNSEHKGTHNSSTLIKQDRNINKTNKDSHNSKHDKRVYESDDINFKLAQSLLSKIEEQNPDHKKPDLQKWANDIRLMHEQDNRSYDKIQKMIDWSQNNDFWSSNVLSATKLRKQYDTMAAQANNEAKGKTTGYHKKSGRIEAATDWNKVKAKKMSNNSNELQERLAKIRGKQDAAN
ncbi:DNA replication protein DnaD [Companilactobacillus sp. HBUAS56257]|uniref:DNA replication protein DnaD n=1 Tax=Companilactobacillus sp. HBUAS56257 TaxID=3109360 RepID=UPI002FF09D97